MSFSLDHVVIAVNDLDRSVSEYAALGFTVLRGGEHPQRGSITALIVFEDGSYFELIAFPHPVQGFRWWEILQKAGPGFVDYALLSEDIEQDLESARLRGLVMGDTEAGGRLTPDNERVEWKTARSPTSDVPFLCGDVTPRALRVPEGDVRAHVNGAKGIGSITVAVRDLAASVGRYEALLSEDMTEAPRSIEPQSLNVSFLCGNLTIKLLSPMPGSTGASEVEQHLEQRGEGPFAVTLKLGSPTPPSGLALTSTHEAALQIPPAKLGRSH
jgi:catechol 2,3-dioxygenase-like lactoylglutathione lyase family enzyme